MDILTTITINKIQNQAKSMIGLAAALAIATDFKTAYGLIDRIEHHVEIIDDMLDQIPAEQLGFVIDENEKIEQRKRETDEEIQALADNGLKHLHDEHGRS